MSTALRLRKIIPWLAVLALGATLASCQTAAYNDPDDNDEDHESTAVSALFSGGGATAFYRGCFSDDATRALPAVLSTGGSTIESCIASAKSAGYTFAGVQYYGQCFAGNTLNYTKLDPSTCNTPCSANTSEMCGGAWANSVYQLTTPGSTTWPGWESASSVAPSWMWGGGWGSADCGLFGTGSGKYCNLGVPGSAIMSWNGQGASLIELRGWLTPRGANGDGDFNYDLELDPVYTAATLGSIDLNPILKVGNILNMQKEPSENLGSYSRAVATPMVHVELSGFRPSAHPGEVAPADWQNYGVQACDTNHTDAANCNVLWAFNPAVFPSEQYVRMVGSIVTDEPHCYGDGDLKDAIRKWARGGCSTDFNSANPARWTELHSPDLIQVLTEPANARSVTVKAVAVVAENGLFSGETNTVDVDLRPPASQLVGGVCPAGILVDERVGPETNYGTITDGNATRSGARIDRYADRAHIHVTVHGESGYGAPGKFKAIYEVRCAPCTPQCTGKCGGSDSCGGSCPVQACGSNQACSSAGYCACVPGTTLCPPLGDQCTSSCPAYCGDGTCGSGESCSSCPDDCGDCGMIICPLNRDDCCGDGICRTVTQCNSACP